MTTKQKAGMGIFVSTLIVASIGIGVYVVREADKRTRRTVQVRSATTPKASAPATDTNGLSVGVSSGLGGGLPEPIQQQSGGGSTAGSAGDSQPTSNDFSQYEQHKDKQAALYADIRAGTGNEVTVNKKVAIQFKGWLTNGTLFDQTAPEKPGEQAKPLVFTVGEHKVVLGIEQGVLGMKGGGKRRIVVPPAVGYGERGFGPVPSNAMMIFDVELADLE